jgi:proline dehydrogenase
MGLKELLVLPVARHWISGVDLESAVKDAEKANSRGIGVVVNFLGEEIKDPATADAHADEYIRLQNTLAGSNLNGFASVKLTQFGMGSDDAGALGRLGEVASNAQRLGQLLWIDMESPALIDRTLTLYLEALERHPRLGVALQAYTRRSGADLQAILKKGGTVRLVKGAYREGLDVVFASPGEVRDNFTKLMTVLFEKGDRFAIATHDSGLVEEAKKLAEGSHADFRFEMLKGIRDDLKADLVKSGYKVFEYLPYGDRWYAYSRRRITEHPSNVWLLLRSLV